MRRRTAQAGKDLTDHVIKVSKKYSYQSKQKMSSAGELYPYSKASFDLAYSEAVAKTFLQDLLESLESKFRKADQKQYFRSISQTVQKLEHQIAFMLDPMSQINKMKACKPYLEIQPQTAAAQVYCGGKTTVLDHKVVASLRPSITFQGSKDEAKDYPSKKEIMPSYSSKCLIKMTKQQKLQRKRSMQALKFESQQLNDKYDDLLKQKIFKQTVMNLTSNLFRSKIEGMDKTNSKLNNNLTAIDEYSYDYDGSALPIRKFGRACADKVKILNPTYKVTHKDILQLRKARTSKYNFLQAFKQLEGQDQTKPKVESAQLHQLNLGRKTSTREYMNDLSCNENKEELDYQWKKRLQEIIKSKSIRIRQIKQI